MAVHFNLRNSGIVDLLEQESMAADLDLRMKRIAEIAKANAPYDAQSKNPDHYKDSIDSGVYREPHVGRWGEDSRPTGYVSAGVAWACAVEVKHKTLAVALEAGA